MKINRLISSAILGIMLVGLLGSTPASAGTTGVSIAVTQSSPGLLAALQRVLSYFGLSNLIGSSSRSNFLGGTGGV